MSFAIAIKREAAARHFYTEAANWAHSAKTRELLLCLAKEETKHEEALKREWEHIKADRDVSRAMCSDI